MSDIDKKATISGGLALSYGGPTSVWVASV